MLISHQRKFVFLANPKTGSQSVQKILAPFSDVTKPKRRELSREERRASGFHNHSTARDLRETFRGEEWDWDAYFSFTMIRNPWDRFVSTYEYAKQKPQSLYHAMAMDAGSFARFVEGTAVRSIEEHAFDEHGKCLVSQIVKLEEVEGCWPEILERIGVPFLPLPHMNRTSRRPYQDYYDETSRELVRRRFAGDIKIGSYVF